MVKPNQKTVFERDFGEAADAFPKLRYTTVAKKGWRVNGEVDICDPAGMYWGTFQIEILVPISYPYVVPLLYEKSDHIPRDIDYHIGDDGLCCVDIDHRLLYRAKSGISIQAYLSKWVYPFFANYLYREREKKYANGEYSHRFDGVRQFYQEELHLTADMAVKVLQALLNKDKISRNDPCPCESGDKLKKCHVYAFEFLKTLGRTKWQSDFDNFMKG